MSEAGAADTKTASMLETHGVGGMLVGAVLASIQFNLYLGLPAYLLLVRVSEQLTLVPSTPVEILVLLGCMTPVFLFCVWSGSTAMPSQPTGEEALIGRIIAGEFDEELTSIVRTLGDDPELRSEEERDFRASLDSYQEANERRVAELVPQLAHLSPDQAFFAAKEESDGATAMAVRYEVWKLQLHAMDDEALGKESELVEAEEVLSTDFARKMAAIYTERVRRGLAVPELPESVEAFARWSLINREVASGRLDGQTRQKLGWAEAIWEMASARDQLDGAAA